MPRLLLGRRLREGRDPRERPEGGHRQGHNREGAREGHAGSERHSAEGAGDDQQDSAHRQPECVHLPGQDSQRFALRRAVQDVRQRPAVWSADEGELADSLHKGDLGTPDDKPTVGWRRETDVRRGRGRGGAGTFAAAADTGTERSPDGTGPDVDPPGDCATMMIGVRRVAGPRTARRLTRPPPGQLPAVPRRHAVAGGLRPEGPRRDGRRRSGDGAMAGAPPAREERNR